MKNLKYLVLVLVLCVPTLVSAADVTDFDELDTCLSGTDTTCNITNTIELTDGGTYTLDLNNKNITGLDSLSELFKVSNATLEVKGSGTITANKDAFWLQGNEVVGGSAIPANLTIGKDVKVISKTSNCVYLRGKGAKLDVYGKLESRGDFSVIQGNGTKEPTQDAGNTVITIYDGAEVINTYGYVDSSTLVNPAIYHPQSGTLTVYGGTIKGVTGIEMRAGDLIVKGGTIIGTAPELTPKANNNGPAVMGAGIAIAQHTTMQDVSIVITDGEVSGVNALYENTLETPNNPVVVTLDVQGGRFESTVEDGNAIDSKNKTEFISGGTFIGGVESGYVSTEGDLVFGNDKDGNLVILDYAKVNALGEKLKKLGLDKYQTAEDLKKDYTAKSVDALMAVAKKQEDITTQAELDAWVEEMEKAIDSLKLIAENPDTADNILVYIACASVAIVGLSAAVIFKKRYN